MVYGGFTWPKTISVFAHHLIKSVFTLSNLRSMKWILCLCTCLCVPAAAVGVEWFQRCAFLWSDWSVLLPSVEQPGETWHPSVYPPAGSSYHSRNQDKGICFYLWIIFFVFSPSVLSQTTQFSLPDKYVYTTCDYQGLQFKFQGLLSGFEHHYTLLLSVSLSQKLLATLTLPFQLTLALQLTLSSLDIQTAVMHDQILQLIIQ